MRPVSVEENKCIKVETSPVDFIISAINSMDFSFKIISEDIRFRADNHNDFYYRDLSEFLREKVLSTKYFSEAQLKSDILFIR